ncbi:MAG TPA: hypothetical protein PK514_14590 [Spirochaetota bacterium]|nr:hypothetical protein [Spirochaetota bacterium]
MVKKKYYELVFEGRYETIAGMLEGFMLASGKKWEYWFSRRVGIETETFAEAIIEWGALRSRLHHVILEKDFHMLLQKMAAKRTDLKLIRPECTKSAMEIKSAAFTFKAKAYAKKYGTEIKSILAPSPAGIKIRDYKPTEEIHESAKGIELYAPDHDYIFTAEGTASGEFRAILDFRKKLDDHPLVDVSTIRLQF